MVDRTRQQSKKGKSIQVDDTSGSCRPQVEEKPLKQTWGERVQEHQVKTVGLNFHSQERSPRKEPRQMDPPFQTSCSQGERTSRKEVI